MTIRAARRRLPGAAGAAGTSSWQARVAGTALLAAVTATAAGAQEAPLPTGITPDEPDGHIAVDAINSTVRPAARDFSPQLLTSLSLPDGFSATVFAEGLEEPRTIVLSPAGHVYVAERSAGQVRLLQDADGDGRAELSRVVTSEMGEDLGGVHGLAVHDGWLYMVTETALFRARIEAEGDLGAPEQISDDIPAAFPGEYRHDAFATMRGSWNRNPPSGYEVVRIRFDESGAPQGIATFASGWLLEGGRAHGGRLMGVAVMPDGALLVGDDTNGVILRIDYDER